LGASPSPLNPQREGRLARERFSAALMSDTKWRKLIEAVAAAHPTQVLAGVKFIYVAEAKTINFPPSLDCPLAFMDTIEFGPVELRAIEWLDLPLDLADVLAPLGHFPIESTAAGTRVRGYSHPKAT